MCARSRLTTLMLSVLLSAGMVTASAAQGTPPLRHPSHPSRPPAVQAHIFIGGYFYDPRFGPYPWWSHAAYPSWYEPLFDMRADVRLHLEPKAAEGAAVYVDGFYAGVVDDFSRVFQAVPLTPGGHRLVLFLDGYRTVARNIYLSPGSDLTIHELLLPLPAGVISEAPELAPPLPEPPAGTYRRPITPRRPNASGTTAVTVANGFGSLEIVVQPALGQIAIDGQSWTSSEPGHIAVQIPAGTHRTEIVAPGYATFATSVDITAGVTTPLNIDLTPATRLP